MQVRSVSLQSDIANYWPGMHNQSAQQKRELSGNCSFVEV